MSRPSMRAKDIAQIAISTNPKFTQLGQATTFRMVANDNLQARAIGSFAASQFGMRAMPRWTMARPMARA
jgi:branched-chain amino acid transport system substrate-binding protein